MSKTPKAKTGLVYCHRLKRDLKTDEHEKCSYCFAERKNIETGEHDQFCDFDPDKDPINFGDDSNSGRMNRG